MLLEGECSEGASHYQATYTDHVYLQWVSMLDLPCIPDKGPLTYERCRRSNLTAPIDGFSDIIQYTVFKHKSVHAEHSEPFFCSRTLVCADARAKQKWLTEFRRQERVRPKWEQGPLAANETPSHHQRMVLAAVS